MDYSSAEGYNSGMRRILLPLSILMLAMPISAERAQLYTPMEPGFVTQTGTFFSPDALEGLSDTIPMGSAVSVTDRATGNTAVITITGKLPELPGERDLALTKHAFQELGDDDGVADVDVSIISEGTIKEASGPTGWYAFDLGLYSTEDAYALYSTLMDNGLRPYASIEDEGVRITVRHVLAFRLDDAVSRLRASGIEGVEPEMDINPYTS